jgi:hypothetical protein
MGRRMTDGIRHWEARLYQRGDGTAMTRDCPVGLQRARVRLAAGLSTAVALLCAAFVVAPRNASAQPASFPERVEYWKDAARSLPLIGRVIEYFDPSPIMGAMVVFPPSGPP